MDEIDWDRRIGIVEGPAVPKSTRLAGTRPRKRTVKKTASNSRKRK
jgi:hypothetical protein